MKSKPALAKFATVEEWKVATSKWKDSRIKQLESALIEVVAWDSLSLDYRVSYGSNGERDYYRGVARNALDGE